MRKKLKMSGSLVSLQAIGQLYFEPYRRVIFFVFLAMCTTTYLQSRFRHRVLPRRLQLGLKFELHTNLSNTYPLSVCKRGGTIQCHGGL